MKREARHKAMLAQTLKAQRGTLIHIISTLVTRKTDTYAFGVVLLEVLCGRPAVDLMVREDKHILTKWARENISKGKVDEIVDSSLRGKISEGSLKAFVEVAERCLLDEPKKRPTMAQVVLQLEFALEQQENKQLLVLNERSRISDDIHPCNDEIDQLIQTGLPTMASADVHNLRPHLKKQANSNAVNAELPYGRIATTYKPSRLWPWDAFWNRIKPSKKKELLLSASIRLAKFDWSTVAAATNWFSFSQLVGQGRYGPVYKAILPTGQVVAVKRLSSPSGKSYEELKNEIVWLPKLQHPNIIQLLGYCIHRDEQLLVYEFMENRSLYNLLDEAQQRQRLQWPVRFNIIIGVARGLLYLHQGLRKIIELKIPRGYMSPEYFSEARLFLKSDVYSFGITVLEIVTGRKVCSCRPNEEQPTIVVDYAWKLWKEGKAAELVDESVLTEGAFAVEEAIRCVQVALLCTEEEHNRRPEMSSVIRMLEGEEAIAEPQKAWCLTKDAEETFNSDTNKQCREWIGDEKPKFSSLLQIEGSSTTSTVIHKLISADPVPHKTARISLSHFSYTFQLSPGQKILRLHFYPAPYKGFKRFKDLFTVEAGVFTLISNFSASLTAAALGVKSFSKEFCLSGDLGAQVVGQKSLVYIDNSTALELIHRLNVKRDSVSSGDDFDDMLGMWATVPAQNGNEFNNLTWKRSVDVGFRYLVRIHFCELGLKMAETGGMIFKILINEMIVDTNTDIVKERDDNGSLWYRDYMVSMKGRKQEDRRDLLICLQSSDEFMDGHRLLKGFEIFKLSNPDNSLASPKALPPARDSPSWIIQNFVSAADNLGATFTEEENRPSARAERVCRRFSLAEIKSATRNFSDAFVIGKGGFGKVYKGHIDNGRETVAIKRLKSNSKQGKHEFLTEIETLSELRHINLVSLIGYCSERREMILVYEFMACGTLADHLYKLAKDNNNCSSITWKQRLNICIGAARGLDYLHTGHRVIHRDVKTSNILLDENFVAKVSDFGLAKPEDRQITEPH
ncbi:UNVERIFIED_CONTAM: Receptor-like protein kinase FERONIA [Sesamum calycinum]|uniref:Receptor-like protein kinase FERONIA n=1 Tax=Sesamum calycinum TaxID=2727403 RepID=A0AAW2KYS7_9LAMI